MVLLIEVIKRLRSRYEDESYGIHVASLAHLPKEVIDRANEILSFYENNNKKEKPYMQIELPLDFSNEENENDQVIEKIKKINPLEMTPIEALNFLYELSEHIKEKR